MIIDCHGHYTTEPKDLHRFRKEQTEAVKNKSAMPPRAGLKMSDDEIRESLESNQIRLQKERGTDVTIFSPRASGMGHHVGDESVSIEWTQICNDLIHRCVTLFPKNFTTGAYYLNADTMAFMQFILSDLFKDFPKLRLIIPHGGGAVPFHWGRFRGLALNNNRPELTEIIKNNVFFDTCVYHQPGIDLLFKVVPVDNILFASEMVGAVRGNDPKTGFGFDDTKRYVEGAPSLSAEDRNKVFEGNARKVYPRINKKLAA